MDVLVERLAARLREWKPETAAKVRECGMSWPERIVIEPEVLAGKPVVRGTRLAVEFILELLAAGQSEAGILANYPGLTRDDILACLAYASYLAHEYKAYPVPV